MGVISQADVEQLLAVGNESQSFEVKGPGSLSEKAFACPTSSWAGSTPTPRVSVSN